MAATISKERMFKMMEEKQLPYYSVTDGRDLIDENMEEGSVDKASDLLKELFADVQDAIVTVKLCNKTKKERAKGGKDYIYYEFKIRLKEKEETGINGINGTVLSLLEKNNDLQRQLLLKEKEHEFDELRREIKEIKKGKGDNSDLEKMAMKALGMMIGGNATQPVAVAGADDAPIETEKVNAQQRVRAALKRLQKIDNDLPTSLELLADYVEKNPDKLPFLKVMLKS